MRQLIGVERRLTSIQSLSLGSEIGFLGEGGAG